MLLVSRQCRNVGQGPVVQKAGDGVGSIVVVLMLVTESQAVNATVCLINKWGEWTLRKNANTFHVHL